MINIFSKKDSSTIIERIKELKPDSEALWGKMNVAQMLAHCNVSYEMVYEDIHKKPSKFMKLILKLLVKNKVTNEKPYSKNNPTAPQFIIVDECVFEKEKNRLINYIIRTQELGSEAFDGKVSFSFGKLSAKEWNNMFAKHLDHHLTQFGV